MLEPLGLDLVEAGSGEEALRHLLAGEFALIVLDVQMPVLDGFETARLIRGRERTRYVPIIFLTAISGQPEHYLRGYQSGAVDYVYKPFEPEILRAKVSVFAELWTRGATIEAQREELAARLAELDEAHAGLAAQAVELERSNAALDDAAPAIHDPGTAPTKKNPSETSTFAVRQPALHLTTRPHSAVRQPARPSPCARRARVPARLSLYG